MIVIADWGSDSLSKQEFISAFTGFVKDPAAVRIDFVESSPSSIHAGFLAAQIVETEERDSQPEDTVIFINYDTRQQKEGAELIIGRLSSGIYIFGPNAEYNFSFIKPKIDELFNYQLENTGTQFRSRDLYSRIGAHLADEMEDEMDLEEAHTNIIPQLTEYFIGHIDNFGNIKTTIPYDYLKGKYELNEKIKIKINTTEKSPTFVNGLFQGTEGELIIYPGSSGPKENPYLEISVWQHFNDERQMNALTAFNHPRPGMKIELT